MTLRRTWPIDKGLPNAVDLRNVNRWQWPVVGLVPALNDYQSPAARIAISAGTGWGVNIAAFEAVAQRTAVDGSAFITNDATVTNAVTLSGAPTTGSRIDVVYVWAPDPTKGDALTTPSGETVARAVPVFGILVGTSANGGLGASPTKPALTTANGAPAGAVELGAVTIPSTATGATSSGVVFAQTFAYATSNEEPRLVRNATERDAIASPFTGQVVSVGTASTQYRYTGSAWMLWNRAPVSISPTNASTGQTIVNFGAGGGFSKFETTVASGIAVVHYRARWSGTGMAFGDIAHRLEIVPEQSATLDKYIAGGASVNDANGGQYFEPFVIFADNNSNPAVRVARVGVDNGSYATWASSQPFAAPELGDTVSGSFTYPVSTVQGAN